jgi:hypothetical protein
VQLEQRRNRGIDPTKGVVVHDRTHQTSVFGQRPGLRLDGLSCQDAADRRQERVAVQEVHIARKLLDGFEAGNPLDLYSPVPSVCQTVFCSSCSQSTLTTMTNTYVYIPPHWHAPVQSSCQPQRSDLRLAKKTQPAAFETATGVVFTQGITRKRLPASRCVLPYMPYLPPTKESGPLTPEELRRSSRQAPQPAHTGPDADRIVAVSVPLPGISSGGSYVHPAFGMELDLDSRRRGLRFFRFDTCSFPGRGGEDHEDCEPVGLDQHQGVV